MKRVDALVYKPHTMGEAVEWSWRDDPGSGDPEFGEGAEVSVVLRADLDRLLAVVNAVIEMGGPRNGMSRNRLTAPVYDAVDAFDRGVASEAARIKE